MPKLTEAQVQDSPETEHRKCLTRTFLDELTSLINRHSMEGVSNTPDYILAQYIEGCLHAYEQAVQHREKWHGRKSRPLHTRYGRVMKEMEKFSDTRHGMGMTHCH